MRTAIPTHSRSKPSSATPRVLIVDDDASVRESLQLLVRCAGWEAEAFTCARDFLVRPQIVAPSCLLLDLALPDLHGLQLQQRMAEDGLDIPIIFVTAYGDVATAVKAMKAGALGMLLKPLSEDVLLNAIRSAIQRSYQALDEEEANAALRDCFDSLSRREKEVMARVVSGIPNKRVGGELGISEVTVKAHRAKVMGKMKADSLAELVRMAARLEAFHERDRD
jgi:RNA polymerase sigma factor (sigma-70 family)